MRMTGLGIAFSATAMILALAVIPSARAQATKDEGGPSVNAPVPVQIATATSIFIANAGGDGKATYILKRANDPNEAYNYLYAAMKTWGRFQLADSPSHADLSLEIRFAVPISDCTKSTTYYPEVELRILDAKSRTLLWTIDEPVEIALRIATWSRNLKEGITNSVGDFQRLLAQPVGAAAGSGG